MKRITQLLTLVVTMLLSTAYPAYAVENPGTVYISYGINNSNDWTWNQSMTKSSDGNSYSYTVENVVGNLRFFVHKSQKANWDAMTAQNASVIYMISGKENGKSTTDEILSLDTPTNAYLYRDCQHCIKVNEKGNLTVTIDFSGDPLTITCTKEDSKPIPIEPVSKKAKHTVYVYNKSTRNIMNLRAYAWNGSEKVAPFPGTPVTFDGKYITIDNNQYPVWEYTFYWEKTPSNIIFQGNGLEQTGDLAYEEGKYYYVTFENGKNVVKTDDPKTDYKQEDRKPVNEKTTIYMHFKRDYVGLGNMDFPPRCHIYKKQDGSSPTTQNMSSYDSDENMYLVNGKYQLWGYDIDTKELYDASGNLKYDNITFYFKTRDDIAANDKGQWREYKTETIADMYYTTDEPKATHPHTHDAAHLTDYIYATGRTDDTHNGAIQTYLSYDRFKFRDKQNTPREFAYIVGSPYMDFTPRVGTQTATPLSWDILNPKRAQAEDGCFYIHLTPHFNQNVEYDKEHLNPNRKIAKFKTGWINVGYAKDWATSAEGPGISSGCDYGQRGWATYDLGIIGVNDLDSRLKIDGNADEKKINVQTDGQNALFKTNTSVSYSNYSQYDWCIVEGLAVDGQDYYTVIDTHSECRSVTLCSFNPQPSLHVLPTEISSLTLTPAHATSLHEALCSEEDPQFHAAAANGHIIMDRVNVAKGYLQVTSEATQKILDEANFKKPIYTVKLKGKDLFDYQGVPKYFQMEYLPVDEEQSYQLRALYEDNETNITFHSLNASDNLTSEMLPQKPTADLGIVSWLLDEDGHFGVWMKNVSMYVDDNKYEVYGDFEFSANKKTFEGEIVNADHKIASMPFFKDQAFLLPYSKKADNEEYDFTQYKHDWASQIILNSQYLPVYLPKVETTEKDFDKLPQLEITGKIHAVYPFLYEPEPTQVMHLNNLPEANNVARRAQRIESNTVTDDGLSEEQFKKLALNKMVRTTDLAATRQPGVVSGVESVEADHSDAPVEYFTVAGVKVMGDPAPGIYLRRQGTKVEKVVIR